MSGLAHSGVRGRSPCTTGVEVRRTSSRVRDEALLNSQWNLNYIGVRSFIRSGAPIFFCKIKYSCEPFDLLITPLEIGRVCVAIFGVT
jgi:hypothetical protein